MNKFMLLLSLCVLATCFACKKTTVTTVDCTGVTPTYTADIKTIINTNCATSGCHSASAKANGLDLSTYLLVKSESSNNRFLGSINHDSGYNGMPQGAAKLSDANIKKITCWIQNGTPE